MNHREEFDLVLDLSREPLLRMPQLPRGYAAPRDDPIAQVEAARSLAQWVGEFEKPRYFAYNERICAHARSGKIGCTKCIDVCSTGAITPAGNGVRIDPYLCMGCGGCATVCPSGAVIHTYPGVEALSLRLQRMLEVYAAAGGRAPVLLFHSAKEGIDLISSLARRGTGLPSSVIPVEIHHSAAIGLDLMLSAIAYGAAGVLFLMAGEEAVEYADAVEREVQVGATIMAGLGYRGTWFKVLQPASWRDLETLLAAHATDAPRQTLRTAAAFGASPEKRTTLRLALDHLVRHAPEKPAEITLPAGALFGGLEVDRQACTLCKACIGACPASALIDYQDAPRLQFIEANCLQCGLCVETCPEDALALRPRLRLEDSAREAIVLHEDEIFCCVRCGKAFGTRRLIEQMTARIGTHAMFAGAGAARRLQMCADCRVLDMIERKDEMSIFDLPKR